MCETKRKIAVLTGGGDCPGLNAVIRAVVKTAIQNNLDIYGIRNGFNGLVTDNMVLMDINDVSGILPRGGTILGTTNRDNPFHFADSVDENGEVHFSDRRNDVLKNLKKHDIEGLIVIGGDGSLKIAEKLSRECGVRVIGVPKTIDNDLPCTERTFGFDTAVSVATEALDRLHSTAESHHRVMTLEVMGRYAGWIALHSGVAGGADCVLIPEIPYETEAVIRKIRDRQKNGKRFSIIVIAEGAKPVGGELAVARIVKDSFEQIRLGGAGERLTREIEAKTGIESRCTVLGYLQRGGSPTAYDRVLSSRYGTKAVENYVLGNYNTMVALKSNRIITVPLEMVASEPHYVPLDNELIKVARNLSMCFGDTYCF